MTAAGMTSSSPWTWVGSYARSLSKKSLMMSEMIVRRANDHFPDPVESSGIRSNTRQR